ncbi:methyltransferase family protein [Kouleothrix sp.]|jgi:protein-S-isoprenylcysteine O-methyltransferase Ste14|uniref:methyltransferase family protein n=1 Tax=Kouleothrix sp. TaxID=2779161 RepID=UPI00391D0C7E
MPVPYWEIISVSWMIFYVYWTFRAIRRHRPRRKAARTFTILNNFALYIGFLLVLLGRSIPGSLSLLFAPQFASIHITGTVFTIVGVSFAIWSRTLLKNNWSRDVAILEDQHFIQSGPYAIVRHPIYTGILFALLGTALVCSTLGSLLGFAFAITSLWQKAHMEEKLLITEFGQQYTNYQHEVRFLIPFIY